MCLLNWIQSRISHIGHFFLGELYARRHQKKEATTHLKTAEALFKEMGMDYWLEEAGKIINL